MTSSKDVPIGVALSNFDLISCVSPHAVTANTKKIVIANLATPQRGNLILQKFELARTCMSIWIIKVL